MNTEKERKRIYRENNREKIREADRIYRENNREKINAKNRERDKLNREKNNERRRKWVLVNKEKENARKRKWRKDNASSTREKDNLRNRIWRSRQIIENELFALKSRVRRAIGKSLKNKGYTKKSRTHEILGCDYETFAAHLEAQFVDGMNWDNRDKWHIDHIIPLASAQTEEDVLRLNHYSNLQPLWAEDNLLKSDKMPPVHIQQRVIEHYNNLTGNLI
jgi:hypothetical protein